MGECAVVICVDSNGCSSTIKLGSKFPKVLPLVCICILADMEEVICNSLIRIRTILAINLVKTSLAKLGSVYISKEVITLLNP